MRNKQAISRTRFSSYHFCSLVFAVTGNMGLRHDLSFTVSVYKGDSFGQYGDGDDEEDDGLQRRSSNRRGGGTWGTKKRKTGQSRDGKAFTLRGEGDHPVLWGWHGWRCYMHCPLSLG